MSLTNNTVLNKKSYQKAFGGPIEDNEEFNSGYHAIVIRDQPIYDHQRHGSTDDGSNFGQGWVKGVSLEPIKFSLSTQWESMGDAKLPLVSSALGLLGTVKGVTNLMGGGDIGANFTSKLLWKKPGYMEISPRFRVVDYYGIGAPVSAIRFLSRFITGDEGARIAGNIGKIIDDLGQSADREIDRLRQVHLQDKGDIAELADDAIATGLGDINRLFELQGAPPAVSIQIGQWFYLNDMIIPSMRLVFSKEVTPMGPMWVDITLTMKSRTIMRGLSDVGVFSSVKDISRTPLDNLKLNPFNSVVEEEEWVTLGDGETRVARDFYEGMRTYQKELLTKHRQALRDQNYGDSDYYGEKIDRVMEQGRWVLSDEEHQWVGR